MGARTSRARKRPPADGTRRVWTNERLGHAGRTETTVEFKQLERQTDARREAVERILAVSDKYASTLDAKKVAGAGINEELVPQIALGATLLDLGSLMGEKTTYGHDLIIVGEAQDKLGALQATYLTRLRAGFLADLEEYVQESQRYNELKRKLESRRLDYDAKLAKVQKAKKEKPELEEEVRAAQFKYEESMQDVENQMVYLSEFEQGHTSIQDLVAAQLEYYQQCADQLIALQANLGVPPAPGSTISSTSGSSRTRVAPALVVDRAAPKPTTIPRSRAAPLSASNSRHDLVDSALATPATTPLSASPRPSYLSRESSHDRLPAASTASRRVAPPAPPSRTGSTGPLGLRAPAPAPPSPFEERPPPIVRRAPSPPPVPDVRLVRATFDFDGESSDELSLRKGDVVQVVEEVSEGWWIGERDGVRGMFPSNYTEPYTPEPAPRPVTTSVTGRSTKSTRSMHSAYNAPPPPAPPAAAAGFRSLPPAMARSYSTPVVGSAAAVCSTCGCDEFKANVFKPQSCNNCFHQH
ncbi:hypothetical protein GGF32_005944 [Allomyces javanicus]|nr:hypothetical protein GGF32_005944 [Allomyces javanicus]